MPNTIDIRNTAARTFANIDSVEHFDKRTISGIGNAAALGFVNVDTEATGIGNCDLVLALDNNKPSGAIVVRIDQAIRQCFSECAMNRRILNPFNSFLMSFTRKPESPEKVGSCILPVVKESTVLCFL